MIIQASNIAMASQRKHVQAESFSIGFTGGSKGSFAGTLKNRVDAPKETEEVSSVRTNAAWSRQDKFRHKILDYLFELLFGKKTELAESFGFSGEGTTGSTGGFQFSQQYVYHEEEEMSFQTQGTVETSDGRSIDFNLELCMSRSFTEAYEQTFSMGLPDFTDPLVINLDCDAADVSDQTFMFDLDADGHEEAISQLTGGSGFLALDRNRDGKINDGSELFGTKSGNGFADLARYDLDHNGWIDEADEIFDKLLIWRKDKDGNDRLTGLGAAGVGAIYLGSAAGDFSLTNDTNETKAKIRSTGFFLYESGRTGTLQQVDFAS